MMLPVVLLLAGLAIGGGGAAGYFLFMHKPANAAAPAPEKEATAKKRDKDYVKIERMMVPLIDPEGRLVRYASLDIHLQVDADKRAEADMNVALARAAITRRMSQESVVSLKDSGVVDYDRADAILTEAVNAGYGKPMVDKVLIVAITTD